MSIFIAGSVLYPRGTTAGLNSRPPRYPTLSVTTLQQVATAVLMTVYNEWNPTAADGAMCILTGETMTEPGSLKFCRDGSRRQLITAAVHDVLEVLVDTDATAFRAELTKYVERKVGDRLETSFVVPLAVEYKTEGEIETLSTRRQDWRHFISELFAERFAEWDPQGDAELVLLRQSRTCYVRVLLRANKYTLEVVGDAGPTVIDIEEDPEEDDPREQMASVFTDMMDTTVLDKLIRVLNSAEMA